MDILRRAYRPPYLARAAWLSARQPDELVVILDRLEASGRIERRGDVFWGVRAA